MATEIHGTCDESFDLVRRTFESNFDAGLELGASVAVVLDGELVVDLWAGDADPDGTRPWQQDTIVNVFSSTKPMATLVMFELVDQGLVDLDTPVATYWPEFAANDKESVLVRHVLGHTAGMCAWVDPITTEQLYDLPFATARLAEQAPLWEPGSAAGYHAITQGHLLGEIVRRVTGQTLGERFRTSFAEPLDADFHIGVGPELDDRIAIIVPPPFPLGGAEPLEPDSIRNRPSPTRSSAPTSRTPRRSGAPRCRPATATATPDPSQGCRAWSATAARSTGAGTCPRTCWNASSRSSSAASTWCRAWRVRLGIGFGINGDEVPISPNPRACYWGGWGGSVVLNDLDARMTFAYAMNRMGQGIDLDVRGVGLGLMTHQVLMTAT
jgi:CubicO group peptidase (beta-lactamase class C family)